MTGSATYARCGDATAVARERLDRAAASAAKGGHWTATDRHGTRWTGQPRAPDRPTAQTTA